MSAIDSDKYRRLEVKARRADSPHPDTLTKLEMHGAGFAVSPPSGSVNISVDKSGKAELSLDEIPDVAGLKELANKIKAHSRRGELILDGDSGSELLGELACFSAELLREQYELSDQQISEILSFKLDESPRWAGQAAAMVLQIAERSESSSSRSESSAISLIAKVLGWPLRAIGLIGR